MPGFFKEQSMIACDLGRSISEKNGPAVFDQCRICCYYLVMLNITFGDQSTELDLDGYNHSDDDIREIVAKHFDVSIDTLQAYEIDRYGKNVVFRPDSDS